MSDEEDPSNTHGEFEMTLPASLVQEFSSLNYPLGSKTWRACVNANTEETNSDVSIIRAKDVFHLRIKGALKNMLEITENQWHCKVTNLCQVNDAGENQGPDSGASLDKSSEEVGSSGIDIKTEKQKTDNNDETAPKPKRRRGRPPKKTTDGLELEAAPKTDIGTNTRSKRKGRKVKKKNRTPGKKNTSNSEDTESVENDLEKKNETTVVTEEKSGSEESDVESRMNKKRKFDSIDTESDLKVNWSPNVKPDLDRDFSDEDTAPSPMDDDNDHNHNGNNDEGEDLKQEEEHKGLQRPPKKRAITRKLRRTKKTVNNHACKQDDVEREPCEICGVVTLQRGGLASHVRWAHRVSWADYMTGIMKYKDPERRREYYKELLQELTDAGGEQNDVDCGEDVKQVKNTLHIRCPECNEKLNGRTDLKNHIKKVHKAVKKSKEFWQRVEDVEAEFALKNYGMAVKCPLCDKIRYGIPAIKRHMKVWHTNAVEWKKICDETVAEMQRKQREGPLECVFCGEKCHGRWNLSYHIRCKCSANPARIKWHHCPKCGSKFTKKEGLEKHLATRHTVGVKEYTCEICGKNYAGSSGLIAHKRNFHAIADKVPIKYYKCELCGKEFTVINRYKIHLTSHTSERSAQCDICGKTFKADYTLKKHKYSVHMNRYPYHCEKCGHGVQKREYLDKHKCGRVRRVQPNEKSSTPDTILDVPSTYPDNPNKDSFDRGAQPAQAPLQTVSEDSSQELQPILQPSDHPGVQPQPQPQQLVASQSSLHQPSVVAQPSIMTSLLTQQTDRTARNQQPMATQTSTAAPTLQPLEFYTGTPPLQHVQPQTNLQQQMQPPQQSQSQPLPPPTQDTSVASSVAMGNNASLSVPSGLYQDTQESVQTVQHGYISYTPIDQRMAPSYLVGSQLQPSVQPILVQPGVHPGVQRRNDQPQMQPQQPSMAQSESAYNDHYSYAMISQQKSQE